MGCTSILDLTPGVLNAVIEQQDSVGKYRDSYSVGLKALADELDAWGVHEEPLNFSYVMHTPSLPPRQDPRLIIYSGERENASKLPSMDALKAFGYITNNPVDDDERILVRIIDLIVVLGMRLGEVLTLLKDCWVEEPVMDRDGLPSISENGSPRIRHGIRFFPEKDFPIAIDWIAEQDVEIARRAINDLTQLCEPARQVAKWHQENPGRLWQYPPERVISVEEGLQYLAYASPLDFKCAMKERRIPAIRTPGAKARPETSRYRAGDIERLFASRRLEMVVVSAAFGKPLLTLADALCVKFERQFSPHLKFVNLRRPQLVSGADINAALGSVQRKPSIFDRHGIYGIGKNGAQKRLKITAQSLRHFKNTIFADAGMSNVHQAAAMHRTSLEVTRGYQHPTAAEASAPMRHFVTASHEEKLDWLRDSIRRGELRGPLSTAYALLKAREPGHAEEFLRTHTNALHFTPWGACTNDFSLEPCRKHLQCFNNCSHYHRTSDDGEHAELVRLRHRTEAALAAMVESGADEAGADRWKQHTERILRGVDEALERRPSSGDAPRRVFPDGYSHGTKSSEPGRF